MSLITDYLIMPDGIRLAIHRKGCGRPTLLLHGFLSHAHMNWVNPSIADVLVSAGAQVIMPDFRGHGQSDQPTNPIYYPPDILAHDIEQVVAQLGLSDFDMVGYSLGARTVVRLAIRGLRARKQVLGGMGLEGVLGAEARRDWFIDAIRRRDQHPPGTFEALVANFLKTTGANAEAAILVMQAQQNTELTDLQQIATPTLVVCGRDDQDNGSASQLAATLPLATLIETPGNHMGAVLNPALATAIRDFLAA